MEIDILKESREFKILIEKSQNLLMGRYSSNLKGDGIEFVDLKEYHPGDDVRKIDWKVTARENRPYIKEFLEDKDSTHYVLLDTSASMDNKSFIVKVLATSLLMSSLSQRDGFSLRLFNSNSISKFPISKSRNMFMRYVYEISNVKFTGLGTLKEEILETLSSVNRKSIISIITDELELDEELLKLLGALSKKHKVNYFQIFSTSEKNLEIGMNSFEDSETGDYGIYDIDEEDALEYKEEYDKMLSTIEKDLNSHGIRPLIIDCDNDLFTEVRKRGDFI